MASARLAALCVVVAAAAATAAIATNATTAGTMPGAVRIAHGTTVTLADAARSMAYVISRRTKTLCSATVIANSWLLLAGHCTVAFGDPIRIGKHHGHEGTQHSVLEIHRHHRYRNTRHGIRNDVMLARFQPPVAPHVPIKLNYDASQPQADASVYGFGYGFDERGRHAMILRVARFHAVPTHRCARKLQRAGHRLGAANLSHRQHLCANENHVGRGMCSGDSGGPLIMKTARGFVQVGVSSYRFTQRCGNTERPDVYARVSSYYGWTRHVIGGGRGIVPGGFVL